jgi:hypothetical protein
VESASTYQNEISGASSTQLQICSQLLEQHRVLLLPQPSSLCWKSTILRATRTKAFASICTERDVDSSKLVVNLPINGWGRTNRVRERRYRQGTKGPED